MTPKQKAFADYYIVTGNATEAARRAGYKEKNARVTGAKNLSKANISAYIEERLSEMDASRLADAAEVMAVFTAILRGEVKDQFGLSPSLHDRIEAGKAIMRRLERIEDRSPREDFLSAARELLANIPSVIR